MASNSTATCAVCGTERDKDELLKRRAQHEAAVGQSAQTLAIAHDHEGDYEFECEEHAMRRQVRDAHRSRGAFDDRCQ